jgi:hypothetical protein
LNAERARLNTALQRLETDKTAAEGKARLMESAAYAAFTIALIRLRAAVLKREPFSKEFELLPAPLPILFPTPNFGHAKPRISKAQSSTAKRLL